MNKNESYRANTVLPLALGHLTEDGGKVMAPQDKQKKKSSVLS